MYRVVYVSAATNLFSKSELMSLLMAARDKNEKLGVTGILLYKDGDVMQLLEGEEKEVKQLLDTILADPRHGHTIVLYEGYSHNRLFPDWSMSFRDLSDPTLQELPGYSNYMNSGRLLERFSHDPDGCLRLISMFKPGR